MSEHIKEMVTPSELGDLPAYWQAFCDQESFKYALGTPLVKDGRRYATDGRIILCQSVDSPDIVPKEGRVPNCAAVVQDIDCDSRTFSNIPDVDLDFKCENCERIASLPKGEMRCDVCEGSGDCLECGGDGDEVCDCCGQLTDCKTCDGSGKCYHCDGENTLAVKCTCEIESIELLGSLIARQYLRAIRMLPNPKIKLVDKDQYHFIADHGLFGKAMAMSQRVPS